jgi:hypothetical protein
MQQRAPDVLDFLVTIAVPHAKEDYDNKVPPLSTAYSILMNTRWKELCLVQKINTILLGVGNATTKVFKSVSIKISLHI